VEVFFALLITSRRVYFRSVDKHLKERMIGAVVLVAVAIILIPEMLSGPRAPTESASKDSSDANVSKLKTYTIDLAKPGVQSTPEASQPKPAESPPAAAAPKVVTAPAPPDETSTGRGSAAAPLQEPAQIVESVAKPKPSADKPVEKPPQKPPAAKPLATKPVVTAETGWTVQVGSFGVRATSERIADELKRDGFSAFVVEFQSGKQSMYRVRVGPERDRAAAEALLHKLKAEHPGATLVSPP
jgi:DedD protein